MQFRVDACNNDTRAANGQSPCASKEEIYNFTRDMEIHFWSISKQMDFDNYKEYPPVHIDNEMHQFIKAEPEVSTFTEIQLVKNTIRTSETTGETMGTAVKRNTMRANRRRQKSRMTGLAETSETDSSTTKEVWTQALCTFRSLVNVFRG